MFTHVSSDYFALEMENDFLTAVYETMKGSDCASDTHQHPAVEMENREGRKICHFCHLHGYDFIQD